MNVILLSCTKEAESIVAAAARVCYSGNKLYNLLGDMTPDSIEKMITKLQDMGHESPFEHISFTFGIEGVSRALSHQLVRHRLASYNQRSQRYVKENQFEYVIPPSIEDDSEAMKIFISSMVKDQESYDKLVELLKEKHFDKLLDEEIFKNEKLRGRKKEDVLSDISIGKQKSILNMAEKKAIEDARYVFPNACATTLIMTMNARELMHFFKERCCNRAQWEIQKLAFKILELCKKQAPNVFKYAGPTCMYKSCKEGRGSCGAPFRVKAHYISQEFWEIK